MSLSVRKLTFFRFLTSTSFNIWSLDFQVVKISQNWTKLIYLLNFSFYAQFWAVCLRECEISLGTKHLVTFHVKIKTFDTQKLEIKLKNFRPSMYMFSNFVEKLLFFVIILYYKFYYLHVIGLFHQKNLKSLKISDFFYFSIKGLYQPITYQSRIFHRLHRFYVLCMHLIGHIKLIGND